MSDEGASTSNGPSAEAIDRASLVLLEGAYWQRVLSLPHGAKPRSTPGTPDSQDEP